MPYQSAPSALVDEELRADCARRMYVLTNDGGRVHSGAAVLFILEALGHRVWPQVARLPPLIWFVELGYWIVARNRRFFSRFLFRNE